MISSLLTIIVPCKDSAFELKKTLEGLTTKTKISGTSVLVADFGSTDGSFQYAAQASSELIRFLKISPIKMEDDEEISDLVERVRTPYVMVISPGTKLDGDDSIIECLNDLSSHRHPLIYLKKNNSLDAFIGRLMKNKRKTKIVFSERDILSFLDINKESPDREIVIDPKLPGGIKISGFVD